MYWRLVQRRGKSIAKVAMARKLLTRLYWMLRRRSESRRLGQRSRVRVPSAPDVGAMGWGRREARRVTWPRFGAANLE